LEGVFRSYCLKWKNAFGIEGGISNPENININIKFPLIKNVINIKLKIKSRILMENGELEYLLFSSHVILFHTVLPECI
jgi:hypothetical protein